MRTSYIIVASILFQCFASSIYCQHIRRASIGIDFILNDYTFNSTNKLNYRESKQVAGVAIHYLQQVHQRYQVLFNLAGSFSDSLVIKRYVPQKKLLLESDISLQRIFSKDGTRLQPFGSVGLGVSSIRGYFGSFVPVGGGLQFNVSRELMTSLYGQYRFSMAGPMRSHFIYGIGISGWLPQKSRKIKKVTEREDIVKNESAVSDRDHDGIGDQEDLCPDVPGFASQRGCPVEKTFAQHKYTFDDSTTQVLNTLARHILFETNSAVLKPTSVRPLNQVYNILKKFPTVRLTIEGHTDSVGTDRNNQTLSEQRALAVKTYLVDKGIQERNLQTVGFGETKPVTTNSTEEGRAQNRRVIFKPLDK